ncbi:MAG: 50S ribosomal protein L3 [Cytophagales bacterium]|nr:50S ribosomal protein L3 [Cytophagales bacterium]
MLRGIIGRKVGMTSLYLDSGEAHACTLVEAGPCWVTQVKRADKEGYDAVQLSFDPTKKRKSTPKPLAGHFARADVSLCRKVVEFRGPCEGEEKEIRVQDVFKENDLVSVRGISKGKGFQGVVKRHNFAGVGEATHGQHNRLRAPGSIGGCSYPARVFKGLKMAGRMGGKRVTVRKLHVLRVLPEKNLLIVKGSVPGAKNGYLVLEKA